MSVHGWCKENNIPFTTCRQWLARLKKEKLRLNENFEKLRRMLFGQSSEKSRFIEDVDQLSFMARIINEAEVFAKDAGKEELSKIQVPGPHQKTQTDQRRTARISSSS